MLSYTGYAYDAYRICQLADIYINISEKSELTWNFYEVAVFPHHMW